MVRYALVAVLLPLAMANSIQQQWPQQKQWGWDGAQYGVQMQGTIMQGGMMQGGMQGGMMQGGMQGGMQQGGQMQGGNNQWWGIDDEEDYAAYLKWCEERRMAIAEQEAQKELLEEMQERAEKKHQEMEREKAMKEMASRRESMMNQWRMWQSQLAQAEEFDGNMNKYMEMKIKYMFSLTMDYLKFCRCSDYAGHLQRYLSHDGMTYEPAMSDAFNLDDLEGIDVGNVDAVAQRMATLSQQEQIKLFFGGIIASMCDSVKTYVDQVKAWETQYNFMGM